MAEFLEVTVDKFLFKVATDRLYSREGVWVFEEKGQLRLGMTDYQQQVSGDVAFAHVKPAGTILAPGDEFVEIETIKATVSLYAPVAGTIRDINAALESEPETVNQDPYGTGWLVVVEPANWEADRARLLDAAAYLSVVKAQAEKELNP
jgi:glycine cleavage system H protein